MSFLLDVFIKPFLENIGIYTPRDPTYGRYLLETSPYEIALEADKDIKVISRRVFLDTNTGQYVQLTQGEIDSSRGRRWVYYKIWERGPGNNCDVVMLHGINDYGGKWACHVSGLLEKGFRIIAVDLPSHGRSSGLHVYIANPEQLLDGVDAVLVDVDRLSHNKRKTFFVGSSMGAGTALNYCARYPGGKHISGVFGIAPMVGIAPETMPPPLTIIAARILRFFAGRQPFDKGIKGNDSDDPRVEAEFLADPRGYHGDLRIATGLTVLVCISHLTPTVAATFTTPFRLIHGNHDRVTSHRHSVKFHEAAGSQDKGLGIYEGYEHVMMKVGVDQKDDERRQRALKDMETWLLKRV